MKPSKKATVIKSVLNKNTSNYSRLTTEPSERPQYLHHHRTATAVDKLSRDIVTSGTRKSNNHTTTNFKKKDLRDSSNKVSQPLKHKPTTNNNNIITNNENKVNDSFTVVQGRESQSKDCKGSNRYQVEKKVGSGTFGTVHKARDKKTLDIVAIKKVYQDKNYKNRELDILKMLSHPNVLSMKDSFFTY